LIHCLKYYQAANEIIFEYNNILQRNAEKIFHFLVLFLKNTGLLKIIKFYRKYCSCYILQSSGGGNAINCCQPPFKN